MNDPRFQADFDPSLYPLCNGKPPPDAGEDGQTTITLEFLAVYYEMNRAYRALLAARASNAGSEAERAALREIERVLLARDAPGQKRSAPRCEKSSGCCSPATHWRIGMRRSALWPGPSLRTGS
jgi:hypothetical protein